MRLFPRKLRHLLEAFVVMALYSFFRTLPLSYASWAGGKIGLLLMRVLKQRNIVLRNLELVFPEKSPEERKTIARGMWNHLGRQIAEFAHMPGNSLYSRMTLQGLHNAPVERPVLYVSAHFGQWELAYPIAHQHGVPITIVYRHANNPYVDRIINRLRATQSTSMFPKGIRGAVQMMRAIKDGNSLAILVDQKMNDGIEVNFFGHKVMAAPAIAQLALKYDMPIVPVCITRTKGAHFNGAVYPPLTLSRTGNEVEDMKNTVQQIYTIFESWIRKHPEQYFWMHRRFAKELYR